MLFTGTVLNKPGSKFNKKLDDLKRLGSKNIALFGQGEMLSLFLSKYPVGLNIEILVGLKEWVLYPRYNTGIIYQIRKFSTASRDYKVILFLDNNNNRLAVKTVTTNRGTELADVHEICYHGDKEGYVNMLIYLDLVPSDFETTISFEPDYYRIYVEESAE